MQESTKKRTTLDRESKEHTRRLKKSLNKVRLSHALMQIFWTAGPVTSLGLIGGYYIGYGTMPSTALLIYFISFTAIAGVIGLFARVIYNTTRGYVKDQGERDIRSVTDKLGDLILITRDMIVQHYEGELRKTEAAMQLLRRVEMTPYGVTIAFTDLTGDKEIGEMMGRIFTYRKMGLQSRVRDLYVDYRGKIDRLTSQLERVSPQASQELKNWFSGNTMESLKYGVQREPGFLQRIMSAIEFDNPYIMTLRDVEEMLILAFELINDREIPTLIFSYKGKWKYARTLDQFQKNRSRFRVAQAKGGNRIRAIASYLIETGVVQQEELQEGLPIPELTDKVIDCMDFLTKKLKTLDKNNVVQRKKIVHLKEVLNNCLELYELAYEGSKEAEKYYAELIKSSKKWDDIMERSSGNPASLEIANTKRGITVQENTILLDEEQKLQVCRHLAWYFKKVGSAQLNDSTYSPFGSRGAMSVRRLAIEIALALEPFIKLSRPEIQRNINATKAIYLGGLSPDLSASQKEDLGKRMSQEVDNSLQYAAEKLADTLVRHYKVDLTDETKEFFRFNYFVSRTALDRIEREKLNEADNEKVHKQAVVEIPKPKKSWFNELSKSAH